MSWLRERDWFVCDLSFCLVVDTAVLPATNMPYCCRININVAELWQAENKKKTPLGFRLAGLRSD